MKKSTLAGLAGAVVAAGLLLAWAFAPRPLVVETAVATQGRFEMAIEEDARTRLRERYLVSAPLAGRLQRIALREGDRVEAGAVIATIEPVLSPLVDERTLREQRSQLEITLATVQRAGARVERARVARQQAANEALRSEQLAQQGFVAPTRLESDRLSLVAAQKELEAAESDRRVAAHGVDQARAALAAVQQPAAGRAFALRSPIAGTVLRVLQGSEASLALGTPLIELGDLRELEVVAELLTGDALKAVPGSRVSIERWGGPAALQGRVRRVEPAAFTKVSALGVEEQRVKVLIELVALDGAPPQWRALGDGFRVGVRIVTLSEEGAVKVPVSAVFPVADDGGAGMAVFVVRDERAQLQRVDVGGRNGSEAWLRSGVAAGARVVVYPPAALQSGARVQVHDAGGRT
ncbi:efflux RND transporter periplasmic adaptor subunit [Pseudaquabacterium terrae]|nr:biotin/lipoyl-binding protein [Aquabacterium terrae]